jgi:hypothetical protein
MRFAALSACRALLPSLFPENLLHLFEQLAGVKLIHIAGMDFSGVYFKLLHLLSCRFFKFDSRGFQHPDRFRILFAGKPDQLIAETP